MEKFLDTNRKKLEASNKLMRQFMDDAGIKYSHGSNAGFFFWVDLSPWLKEEDGKDGWERKEVLMKKLLNNKVFILNGGIRPQKSRASSEWCFRMMKGRFERDSGGYWKR